MWNFPSSWAAANLAWKVQRLLEKFGRLAEAPRIVRGAGGVVATATFLEASRAEQAVKTLHNVDNRTEAEKRATGLPASDADRFQVKLVRPQEALQVVAEAEGAPQGDEDLHPCLVVRGFPATWKAEQVKLVFAVFGGVCAVAFGQDGDGRFAKVQLKNFDNMPKAAEQLHNTKVGDGEFIEECVISCEFVDKSSGPQIRMRSLFLDELEMPDRPDAAAGPNDRELFLRCLPVAECSEEQIHSWLEGFGPVEQLRLLREGGTSDGARTGLGYVLFASHGAAAACAGELAPGPETAGDVIAEWSESERARQGAQSAYGAGVDVRGAFSPLAIAEARRAAGALGLHLATQEADVQVHFLVECSEAQLQTVRAELSATLAVFHRKAAARRRSVAPTSRPGAPPPKAPSSASPSAPPARPAPAARPAVASKTGAPQREDKGRGREAEELDSGLKNRVSRAEDLLAKGRDQARDPSKARGAYECYCRGLQGLLDVLPLLPAPHSAKLRLRVDVYLEEAERLRSVLDVDGRSSSSAPKGNGDGRASKREEGEALLKEGREEESRGNLDVAYERYCTGLQVLLEAMPPFGEPARELRARVDAYLQRAERLKERLRPPPAARSRSRRRSRSRSRRGGGPGPIGGGSARGARSGRSPRRSPPRVTAKAPAKVTSKAAAAPPPGGPGRPPPGSRLLVGKSRATAGR